MKLELYQFSSCPYCQKVLRYLDQQGLQSKVKLYDTLQDEAANERLLELTGDDQVPCLVIDGKPLLESDDIVAWLKENL
jgi:glutaredoxin